MPESVVGNTEEMYFTNRVSARSPMQMEIHVNWQLMLTSATKQQKQREAQKSGQRQNFCCGVFLLSESNVRQYKAALHTIV